MDTQKSKFDRNIFAFRLSRLRRRHYFVDPEILCWYILCLIYND